MMAFDRTPSPPGLEPQTIEALRDALAHSVREGTHGDHLRALLCEAAGDARAKGIQAEQLLLILKDIWYSLPGVVGAISAHRQNQLLQELISRCIQEYYSL